jgi:hypothetical protein
MGEVIREGRYRASFPEGTVVFLIGMRINRLRDVWNWWPVFMAMPRMLRELGGKPEVGLLGTRTAMGGRTITVVQYWRSMDALMDYARAAESEHLPSWKAFNQRARKAGASVGIWHEAYTVSEASSHTVYTGMPEFGMAKALGSVHLPSRK